MISPISLASLINSKRRKNKTAPGRPVLLSLKPMSEEMIAGAIGVPELQGVAQDGLTSRAGCVSLERQRD